MNIELATPHDVPAILDLQRKAFAPLCKKYCWEDAMPMVETLEHTYEEFAQCTTLIALDEGRRIVGSIRGTMAQDEGAASTTQQQDSLYLGRLMVLPECQRQGIGRQLFHAIQSLLPHSHAWLCTCPQVSPMYDFYIHEGFRPYRTEAAKHGYTWVYMEKPPTPTSL